MPLLRVEAERLSNNELEAGIIKEIIDRDELFALMPFFKVNSKSYTYNREKTISGAEWLSPVTDTVPEGAAEFEEVTSTLKILAGQVEIDKFLSSTMADTNSQTAIQLLAKAKGLGRQFRNVMVNGDNSVNPKQPDGLKRLTTAGQTIAAGTNGNPLSLSSLDELVHAVPLTPDALMMNARTYRAYKALLRAAGGNDAVMLQLENFGKPVPSHDGTPIIINDWVQNDEDMGTGTGLTSVYAVRLNEADGFSGIWGGDTAGVQIETLDMMENKDASLIRLKWYVSMVLKSTQSTARLAGIAS